MALSKPAPRKKLHTRKIICDGYERQDGLWDFEARMEDAKHYAFENKFLGKMEAGDPIHEMYMRLTLDDDAVVRDVDVHMEYVPFAGCSNIEDSYRKLIGVKVGIGWRRAIMERLGGNLGCTHLTEMLPVIATVAFQTMMPLLAKRRKLAAIEHNEERPKTKPYVLDTCHTWAADGNNAKKFYPDHYTGNKSDEKPDK